MRKKIQVFLEENPPKVAIPKRTGLYIYRLPFPSLKSNLEIQIFVKFGHLTPKTKPILYVRNTYVTCYNPYSKTKKKPVYAFNTLGTLVLEKNNEEYKVTEEKYGMFVMMLLTYYNKDVSKNEFFGRWAIYVFEYNNWKINRGLKRDKDGFYIPLPRMAKTKKEKKTVKN